MQGERAQPGFDGDLLALEGDDGLFKEFREFDRPSEEWCSSMICPER
jgi:hypothetical protein